MIREKKNKKKMRTREILLIIVLVLFLWFHSSGMSLESVQQSERAKELQHEVTVTLKLIQVYVTDKQGNPVTDLKKSDFELWDNGKQKTITEFEKHVLFPSPETKITLLKKTQIPPSRKHSRKFLLFFDFAFNSAQGISRAKKAASYLVDSYLFPTDEVSVISYSASRGLALHSDLTTDHQMIRRIVKKFGMREVLGRAKDITSKVQSEEFLQLQKREYRYHIITYSRKIRDLAKALRYVPGQKHIVFFSSGIEYNVLFLSKYSQIVRENYEEMAKEMAASNCIIHSVYTGASDADMELDQDVYVTGRKMSEIPKKDIKETGAFSLGRLSEVTGGKYFGNIHRYEEIMEEIQKVTGSFYVLGYYVNEKWDGKYHRIGVKVNRKGYQVHAQKGYFNPKPFAQFSKIEKELHLMGLALNRKSVFDEPQEFPLIALPFSEKEGPNVVLLSEINPEKMEEVLDREVEIVTFTFNPLNEILDQIRIKMDFSDVSDKKNYYYNIFSFKPGKYECRVVLRNSKTGKAAVASSYVSIPISYSGIHLFKPLVFIPDKEANYVYAKKGQKKANSGFLDLAAIYPSISGQSSVVIEEVDKGVSKILAEVRCLMIGIQDPEIELSASLIRLSNAQEVMPLSFSILSCSEKKEMDILLLEFRLPELESGQYSLNLVANEIKTKSISQVNMSFKIKSSLKVPIEHR